MILLDTNVLVDFLDPSALHREWAARQIEDAVVGEGGAVNAIVIAELCAGARDPDGVPSEVHKLGLEIYDLPSAAAPICGKAYRRYKLARASSGDDRAPAIPLPDFFIGAHAEVMGWKIATRDPVRFERYFPSVVLLRPQADG